MPIKKGQKDSYKLLKVKKIKMWRYGGKIKEVKRMLHFFLNNSSIFFYYRYLEK